METIQRRPRSFTIPSNDFLRSLILLREAQGWSPVLDCDVLGLRPLYDQRIDGSNFKLSCVKTSEIVTRVEMVPCKVYRETEIMSCACKGNSGLAASMHVLPGLIWSFGRCSDAVHLVGSSVLG